MTFQPERETFAATDTSSYHVATTEWDSKVVRFFWDGKLVASDDEGRADEADGGSRCRPRPTPVGACRRAPRGT